MQPAGRGDYMLREGWDEPSFGGIPLKFFRTVAGPDETAYPEEGDSPTVYYARMLKNVSFTETPGAQSLSYANTDTYKHIFNMEADKYIEEGSVVMCWKPTHQWYTIDKVVSDVFAVGTEFQKVYAWDSNWNLLWTWEPEGTFIPARVKIRGTTDIIVVGRPGADDEYNCIRLDSKGEEVWTRNLAYDELSDSLKQLRDVTFTSDGGVAVVGTTLGSDGGIWKLNWGNGSTQWDNSDLTGYSNGNLIRSVTASASFVLVTGGISSGASALNLIKIANNGSTVNQTGAIASTDGALNPYFSNSPGGMGAVNDDSYVWCGVSRLADNAGYIKMSIGALTRDQPDNSAKADSMLFNSVFRLLITADDEPLVIGQGGAGGSEPGITLRETSGSKIWQTGIGNTQFRYGQIDGDEEHFWVAGASGIDKRKLSDGSIADSFSLSPFVSGFSLFDLDVTPGDRILRD